MPGVVISNTSPLQYLYQAGLLDLLPGLFGRVVVPQAVVDEIAEGRARGLPLPDIAALEWTDVRSAQDELTLPRGTRLGAGEREAMALARETAGSSLILDDAQARKNARLLGLSCTGTVGVLVDAKASGLLPAVAPVLDKLQELGFHLSADIKAAALKLAGEAE